MNINIQLLYNRKFTMYHSSNLGHHCDFSNLKILDKERNLEKILIVEMIKIFLNNNNSINRRSVGTVFRIFIKKI